MTRPYSIDDARNAFKSNNNKDDRSEKETALLNLALHLYEEACNAGVSNEVISHFWQTLFDLGYAQVAPKTPTNNKR